MADRLLGPLADGEVLDLGGKRVRHLDTPHIPHGWEARVIFEKTTVTLLCGDLFTHMGSGPALVGTDLVVHRRRPGPATIPGRQLRPASPPRPAPETTVQRCQRCSGANGAQRCSAVPTVLSGAQRCSAVLSGAQRCNGTNRVRPATPGPVSLGLAGGIGNAARHDLPVRSAHCGLDVLGAQPFYGISVPRCRCWRRWRRGRTGPGRARHLRRWR